MADERFKAAYEAAMDDVAKAQVQLLDKKKVANTLAVVYGVAPPFDDADAPAPIAAAFTIKPDQFANFAAPSEAARAFLKARGEAVGLDTILEGLKKGGFAFTTSKSEQAGGLAKAMGKDKLVRRMDNGFYGLWEWYPKAKREKKPGEAVHSEDDVEGALEDSPIPPAVESSGVSHVSDSSEKPESAK